MMNQLKALGVLMCLQVLLLCGWAVSTGCAETVVNIDNKTIDSILVTVICMECPSFGWGDATPCWDTGNNVSRSVPANTKGQFLNALQGTGYLSEKYLLGARNWGRLALSFHPRIKKAHGT